MTKFTNTLNKARSAIGKRRKDNSAVTTPPDWQVAVRTQWQQLTPRDQMALALLLAFLLLLGGGYGGYLLHQAAQSQRQAYQQNMGDYFWLRAQAGNIRPSAYGEQSQQPLVDQLRTLLQQQNVNDVQLVESANAVDISFGSDNQNVVSRTLQNIRQRGWQVAPLNITQDPQSRQLTVQATVSVE